MPNREEIADKVIAAMRDPQLPKNLTAAQMVKVLTGAGMTREDALHLLADFTRDTGEIMDENERQLSRDDALQAAARLEALAKFNK